MAGTLSVLGNHQGIISLFCLRNQPNDEANLEANEDDDSLAPPPPIAADDSLMLLRLLLAAEDALESLNRDCDWTKRRRSDSLPDDEDESVEVLQLRAMLLSDALRDGIRLPERQAGIKEPEDVCLTGVGGANEDREWFRLAMEEERDMTSPEGGSDWRIIAELELDVDVAGLIRFLGAEDPPEDFDGRDSGEEELRSCGPRVILSRVDQLTEGDRDWLREEASPAVGATFEGDRLILDNDADVDERDGGEAGNFLAPTFKLDSDEVLLRLTATANRLALLAALLLAPESAAFVTAGDAADDEELDEQLDDREELIGATVATFFLDSHRVSDADEFWRRWTGRSEEFEALDPLLLPAEVLSAWLLEFEAADDEEADFLAWRFAFLWASRISSCRLRNSDTCWSSKSTLSADLRYSLLPTTPPLLEDVTGIGGLLTLLVIGLGDGSLGFFSASGVVSNLEEDDVGAVEYLL